MSVALVQQELARFLASKEPEVLCITGRWGVGKTYAWQQRLDAARAAGQLGFKTYSYVSLFGVNSIAEVRTSIAENTIVLARDSSPEQPSPATMRLTLDAVMAATRRVRKLAGLLPIGALIPKGGEFLASADRLIYLAMRDQIVCIDDLERAGKDLTPLNVLGLASQIKEQKRCKVVLLLNSDSLIGSSEAEFTTNLEKVADTILRFEPTPAEAATIAVQPNASYAPWLISACTQLQVTNIRVIKKAERLSARLMELLEGTDSRILKSAVKTIALATVAKFQPGTSPSIKFLLNLDEYQAVYMASDKDEQNSRWMSLLSDYGYSNTDELDAEVIRAVESGSINSEEVKQIAAQQQYQFEESDRDDTLRAAWKLYRNSFDENEEEVVDALLKGAVNAMQRLTPHDLSQITTLLRALGYAPIADKLIEEFIIGRRAEPDFWHIDNHFSFAGTGMDPAIAVAFARKRDETKPPVDFDAVIERLSHDNAWGTRDLELLASLSVAEWCDRLRSTRGEEFARLQRVGLRWRQIAGPSREMTTIVANCTAAIQKIALGSKLNTQRARERGIDVPPIIDTPETN